MRTQFYLLLLISLFWPVALLAAEKQEETGYFYELPTMEKLSQLYWAISKMDINDDDHIDNFLRINECDIYRDYYHHEFEWRDIRAAGRDFLKKGQKSFPLRFEIMQPLTLGEYDFERERFAITEKYQINGVRRFEVLANDYYDNICGTKRAINGYPRGMVLELSRPLVLDYIDIPKEQAELYISEKLEGFRKINPEFQTKKRLFEARDAYLVLKVKVFAYQGVHRTWDGVRLAEVLAVLEGVDVFSDREKTKLLYTQSFRKRKKISRMEQELKKQYEAQKTKVTDVEAQPPSEAEATDVKAGEGEAPVQTPEETPAETKEEKPEEVPG